MSDKTTEPDGTVTPVESERTESAPALDRDATAQTPPRSSGGGGFAAALLGGVIAGGIGYVSAYYTEFGLFDRPTGDDPLAEIAASLETQAARLEEIEGRASSAPDSGIMSEVESRVSNVGDQLATLAQRLEGLETAPGAPAPEVDLSESEARLTELEQAMGDTSGAETDSAQSEQLQSLSGRVDTLTSQIESQTATIEQQAATIEEQSSRLEQQSAAIAEAEQVAERETNRIAAQGAVSEIRAALQSGKPYADAVGQLDETGAAEIPDALSGPAGSGVASLAALQESYPGAARGALSDAVGQTAGDGALNRFGAFLKAQTGARSLSEQEGDSPDAILSRAEARLAEGDLEATLSEIDTLPQAGQDAMADWTERARTRLDAVQALESVSQTLNSK